VIPAEFAYGLGSGLIVAAVLYLVLRWRARQTASKSPPPVAAAHAHEDPPRSEMEPAPVLPAEPVTPVRPPPNETPPSDVAVDSSGGPATGVDVPDPSPKPSKTSRETLRLSQRIILHVYGQGTLRAGDVAPPGLCQAGIGEALGIPQGGLAAVLRRLEAADILVAERGHVRGHDRRLKVYRLTQRGLELAKELRTRPVHRSRG
jgi:DNA-binding MarR family transcriptional regulator